MGRGGNTLQVYIVVSEMFSKKMLSLTLNCCDSQTLKNKQSFLEQSLKTHVSGEKAFEKKPRDTARLQLPNYLFK